MAFPEGLILEYFEPTVYLMSHLVIARKFRPLNFKTVIGQSHICKILQNSIKRNRVAHAYLFSGPRGVGKTSLARIFSKSLNCQALKDFEPCLECANCKEIAQGISLAVREIDGASHNSVDNIRELIDSFRAMPPAGSRFKIFIIDEVHMLSTAAFNALLKSLEEPPPNTVFILATTETHKIPETVLSRCQQHEFRMLDLSSIESALEGIIKSEGYKAEDGVVQLLARYAEGSLRDSQSLLERVIAYSSDDNLVTLESVQNVLGVASPQAIRNLWSAILKEDSEQALSLTKQIFSTGVDLNRVLKEFVEYIRKEFNQQVTAKNMSQVMELEQLLVAATRGADMSLRSLFGETLFEALVVKLALRKQRGRAANELVSKAEVRQEKSPGSVLAGNSSSKQSENTILQEIVRAESNNSVATSLDWRAFISSQQVQAQKILSEHLKRMVPQTFIAGQLKIAGPAFNISALQRTEISERLKHLLAEYSGFPAAQWKIELKADSQNDASIYNQEKKARADTKDRRSQMAIDHPSVKKLQQAFPGSSITKVVVRE